MNFVLGDPRPLSPEEVDDREKARQRVAKQADPLLLRRIDRWVNHHMAGPPPTLPIAMRPQPTRFEKLSDWYAGYLGVRGEVEIPYELQKDLKERVPQAILRDVYRPVRNQILIDPVYHDVERDSGGKKARREIEQALARPEIPTIEPTLLVVISELRRRRRLMTRPWQSFRKDDAPREYREEQDIRYYTVEDDDE